MNQQLIPITVITGFLGSGKTSLLNHLLENNQGVKFGVVVNDFGDINIDSQLVEKKTDATLQLSNGCICCSVDIMGLEEALAQFAYPGSQINYILIEASGLAESAELLSNLGAAATKQLGVRLDGIVCVIDAENIEHNAGKHETAVSQIENANFIVINKVDLVNPVKLKDIKKMVSLLKPKARVFEATHGAIEMHLILDQEAFESAHAHADTHTHGHKHSHHPSTEPDSGQANHLHEHFTKMTFTADRPLDPIAFQDFVNNHIPTTVYRAKGFVDMGTKVRGMQCVFQLVGSRATITWDTWREMTPSTQLVFIGQDFDAEALKTKLAQCIDTDPSATTTADLPRTNTQ